MLKHRPSAQADLKTYTGLSAVYHTQESSKACLRFYKPPRGTQKRRPDAVWIGIWGELYSASIVSAKLLEASLGTGCSVSACFHVLLKLSARSYRKALIKQAQLPWNRFLIPVSLHVHVRGIEEQESSM